MSNRTMVPFVKWVGGKRQVMNEIKKHWPKESFNTYFEPFIGGGAVLFNFQPKKAVINDLNTELINLYKVIASKDSYKRFREYLLLMEEGHYVVNEEGKKKSPFYDFVASTDRNTKPENREIMLSDATDEFRAARFLFLNKNGFNGLYRVNSSGYYNTPSKHTNTKTFVESNIKEISNYLSESVKIHNDDYEKILEKAKKGDFVYLDPPYDYEVGIKGFDSYQKEGFGTEGQRRLAKVCQELDKRGVKFLLSNHDTKLIRELYKEFKIVKFKVNRLVGGKGSTRNPVYEVLVKNYE